MVQHMGANVMMNLVENAVISVNGGQAPSEVRPFLHNREIFYKGSCFQINSHKKALVAALEIFVPGSVRAYLLYGSMRMQ